MLDRGKKRANEGNERTSEGTIHPFHSSNLLSYYAKQHGI
jgi:hypothetical protein